MTAQSPASGGVVRCGWVGSDPLYAAYHDEEWGVPCRDGREHRRRPTELQAQGSSERRIDGRHRRASADDLVDLSIENRR